MKKKFSLKDIDSRKVFGTIIGGIFFIYCILFFTYAYYVWESDETNVTLGIEDISSTCTMGEGISAQNIGPVLDYNDGVAVYFSINNGSSSLTATDLKLNIATISDNLKVDSFKWKLLVDRSGGTSYEEISDGNFSGYDVGINDVATLNVAGNGNYNYKFIVYIDGTVYNNPNMQNNSLVATLDFGECGGGKTYLDYEYYMYVHDGTNELILLRNDGATKFTDTSMTWSSSWDKRALFSDIAQVCAMGTTSEQSTLSDVEIYCLVNEDLFIKTFDNGISSDVIEDYFDYESSIIDIDVSFDTVYLFDEDGSIYTVVSDSMLTPLASTIPTDVTLRTCGISGTDDYYCVYENGQFGYFSSTGTEFVFKGTDNLLKNATTIGAGVWFVGGNGFNNDQNGMITHNNNIVYNTKPFYASSTTSFTWYSAQLPTNVLECTMTTDDSGTVVCLGGDGFVYKKHYQANTWTKTDVTIAEVS